VNVRTGYHEQRKEGKTTRQKQPKQNMQEIKKIKNKK
jgi:hypothetical protein